MAEFKLGRIRFVWKNNWTTSTTYYKDDVVFNGGRMYICVIGHESQANFYSDFDVVPPKWNIVSVLLFLSESTSEHAPTDVILLP